MLAIELTNICNFKCFFCDARKQKSKQLIGLEKFKELINSASELGIKFLKLTPAVGEIFTDKSILEKLEIIEQSKIETCEFHTNFSLCNTNVIDKLSKFTKLKIYVSDYGCGDLNGFKYLTQMKDPIFKTYQENLIYARKIGLNFILDPRPISYDYSFDNSNDKTVNEDVQIKQERDVIRKGVCKFLHIPRINAKGDFIYCTCSATSEEEFPEMIIGNIYDSKLEDLYYSAKRYKIIQDQKNNIYTGFCKACDTKQSDIYSPTISSMKAILKCKEKYDGENSTN